MRLLALLPGIFAACLLLTLVPTAYAVNLFGRCSLFDAVVKERMLQGKITPEQAFGELDSHNCPIIRGHSITNAQQLQQAVQESLSQGTTSRPKSSGGPPGQSMADECRRLSDMLYAVDNSHSSVEGLEAAKKAMDSLSGTRVPLITNCPLFRGVRARYEGGEISARSAIDEMKSNCPILSKELNPAMLFNYEEYGGHYDAHYDVEHEGHGHPACCCRNRASARPAGKKLYAHHKDQAEEPGICLSEGNSEHPGGDEGKCLGGKAAERVSGLEKLLGGVFPKGNPAAAAMLGTFYISLFPNLVLFATPSSISNRVLRVMVGFAVGGLLGDVFLHLMPHMFSGGHNHEAEQDHGHGHGHGHGHARDVVFGCTIFFGLIAFFVVDKFMRLLGNEHSHSHGHSHSHSHSHGHASRAGDSAVFEAKQKQRKRRASKTSPTISDDASEADDEKEFGTALTSNPDEGKKLIKHSAYLNLIADAAHNFTDGLAMSASFYLSHAAGLSTFVAVFFHEIPHELGDFAILVQSGFSRSSALASQFFTALGAIAGTMAGILIEETGRGNVLSLRGLYTPGMPVFVPAVAGKGCLPSFVGGIIGLFPSTVAGVPWSQLVIPFTAGGFIYVGTVSVLPDLLQPDTEGLEVIRGGRVVKISEKQRLKRGITMACVELGAMLLGLGIMAVIALGEE